MRRQFNLAFFKRLLIGDDYSVMGELAEPFDVLLGQELRRAVVAQTGDDLLDAIEAAERQRLIESADGDNEQRPHEPERALVGAGAVGPSRGHGLNQKILVQCTGRSQNQLTASSSYS
jgi:hypothetical protein